MSLTRVDLRGTAANLIAAKLPRPPASVVFPTEAVQAILGEVRVGGDAAVRRFTLQFDGVDIDDLRVDPEAIRAARSRIPVALLDALEVAYRRITAYHRHEAGSPLPDFELEGVRVQHRFSSVDRAGLYAPGGRARYPSTVLMCAAPARVAGVKELALCVPPLANGHVAEETLAAAAVAGIDEVYRVGGAQAIGAMAYGTESIRAVDVIVGPGNRFVAEAKRQVAGTVGVAAAFAGPSEVVVVADETTPVLFAAIDLLVQAEHGPDGQAWLVTWSPEVLDAVSAEVDRLVIASPRRADLEATIASGGFAVLVDGPEAGMAASNAIAPEHLELLVEDTEELFARVTHAGAVFLGPYAPASVGDYVAGPNHVLPTDRTARFASALGVEDFRTRIHAVSLDARTLEGLAPTVRTLAEAEGLTAHGESIRLRIDEHPNPAGSGSRDIQTATSAETSGEKSLRA
jgi:histidinol dehydrogenase